ncbi:TolC family protein [Alcaligenaceae bacterium]|nr:TolC family protein [Alcaligenaceae bacterium]
MVSSKSRATPFSFLVSVVALGLVCGSSWAQDALPGQASFPLAKSLGQSQVIDLSTAWRRALNYDYRYQAAISEQAAAQTEYAQGRAGLLPNIQAGYVRSKVTGNSHEPDALGQVIGLELDYDSSHGYVQLQQPLINYGRYANYKRGIARSEQGSAVLAIKHQEAGVRLATAYFNVLLAYDHLALKRALAASLQERAAIFQAHFLQFEGTRTEAQETLARLAVARAEVIQVMDDLVVAVRELSALMGATPVRMAALQDEFPVLALTPSSLGEWLDRARVGSVQVLSSRQALLVADAEVDNAASEYLPYMDLVATYNKSDSENLSALSQRSNSFVIGIQVSIPLFAGGYTRANVARARLDRMRLQYQLNAAIEKNQAEVTRQFTEVSGGAARIEALQTAASSARASLDAANLGFSVGEVGNLDVLRVQDTLYQARYELLKARLEYLLARLKLAAAVGTLNGSHFDTINDAYLGRIISVVSDNR